MKSKIFLALSFTLTISCLSYPAQNENLAIHQELSEHVCKKSDLDEKIKNLCDQLKAFNRKNDQLHVTLKNDTNFENSGFFSDVIQAANVYLDAYNPLFRIYEAHVSFTQNTIVNHIIFLAMEGVVSLALFAYRLCRSLHNRLYRLPANLPNAD